MANKVGPLIKEARGKAKLSQEALAGQIDGLSAADLGKAERGEKELSQSVLRQIAKITGVTQSSLINAAKESSYGAVKKPESKTSASAKKPAAVRDAFALTAAEKKLVELYRAADNDTKKKALAILKGEQTDTGDILTSLLGTAIDMLGKK